MNKLRMDLANWLSGGAFYTISAHFNAAHDHRMRLRDAISEIASMETPNANATVKRMAKVAREAIGE